MQKISGAGPIHRETPMVSKKGNMSGGHISVLIFNCKTAFQLRNCLLDPSPGSSATPSSTLTGSHPHDYKIRKPVR